MFIDSEDTYFKYLEIQKDTIKIRKIYIDMTKDFFAGVLLDYLIELHIDNGWYNQPDKWIPCKRSDFWDTIRLSPRQIDRIVKLLVKKDFIKTKIIKINDIPQLHISINYNIISTFYIKAFKDSLETMSKKRTFTDGEGFIYIIKSGDLYKIGKSKNIKQRLHSHQTSNPHKIELVCVKQVSHYSTMEKMLHEQYKHLRKKGEWFELSKFDLDNITQLLEK